MTETPRDPDDPWLTLAEIAEELRVNPATVRQWVTKGQLKASRAGLRKWIVRRSDLTRMLALSNPPDIDQADSGPAGPSRDRGSDSASSTTHTVPPESPPNAGANAAKLLQYAEQSLTAAFRASASAPPSAGYVDRLRAIADGCEHVAATILHASQSAGMQWRGGTDFGPEKFPYEVRPCGNRPRRDGLWDAFDRATAALAIAMTGYEMAAAAESFREVGDTLVVVADELERDGRWQAGSAAG